MFIFTSSVEESANKRRGNSVYNSGPAQKACYAAVRTTG